VFPQPPQSPHDPLHPSGPQTLPVQSGQHVRQTLSGQKTSPLGQSGGGGGGGDGGDGGEVLATQDPFLQTPAQHSVVVVQGMVSG
jgi:hypothetical protein